MTDDDMVCITPVMSGFEWVWGLSAMGVVLSSVIAALTYMFGEATSNARLLAWSKAEIADVLMTGVIAVVMLSIMATLGTLTVGSVKALGSASGETGALLTDDSQPLYCGAEGYLRKLADYTYGNMAAIRSTIGAYEKEASENRWKCQFFCLMGGSGVSVSPNAGRYTEIGTLSLFLQGATVSHLAVIFQLYTLKYIYLGSGLLVTFLPLGIVLRSLPFVRGFGGALIALVFAMYIFYPFMLIVDGLLLEGGFFRSIYGVAGLYERNALTYIAAIFLPAINFIVIAALTHTLSGALGEEIDVSRLGQML